MKNYRIFTCLLAMLLAGMIGFSAIADSGLNAKELAVQAAEAALAAAESKVNELLNTTPATVTNAEKALENKQADLALNASNAATNASEIADVQAQLADVATTIAAKKADLNKQKETLEAGVNNAANAAAAVAAAKDAADQAEADAIAAQAEILVKEEAVAQARKNAEATAKNLDDQLTALNQAKQETAIKQTAVTTAETAVNTAKQAIANEEAIVQGLRDALKEAQNYKDSLPPFMQGLAEEALKYAQSALDAGEKAFQEKLPELNAAVATAEANVAKTKQDLAIAEADQAVAQEAWDAANTANEIALANITVKENEVAAQKAAAEQAQKDAKELSDKLAALLADGDPAALKAAAEEALKALDYGNKLAEIEKLDDTLAAELAALEVEKAQLEAKKATLANELTACEKAVEDAKAAAAKDLANAQAALQAAKDALQAAKDALEGAVNSGECLHSSSKLNVFGSKFCVLKAIGSCTHGDTCCPNVSTGTITNTIKGYIQSGDFAGLKSEAQNLYNQLGALQGSPVVSVVKDLIERAVDAKANEYLGAEKWAELKNLANQMMTPGELENMVNQAVNQLRGQIESAINNALNGNTAALNALMAKIDELKAYFGNIDIDKAEIEAKLVQAAKNYLKNVKAEIEAMINAATDKVDLEKIEAAINNAVAALRNLDKAEIKAAIEQFVAELKDKLNDKFGDLVSSGKAEIEAMIQAALNSECVQHISNKVAALKAAIEAKLADVHVCEESVEVIAQEVKALVEACEADILSYLQQKADDLCGKLPNVGLNESEVKALIAKAISALKELAESKLNSLQNVIREILGHTRIVLPAEAPTCGASGLTEGLKCVCGYVIIAQEPIPATGNHQYVNGECACGAKDPNYVTPEKPTDPAPSVKPDPTPTPTPPAPPVVTPKPPVVTPEPPVVTPVPPVVTPEIPVIPPMKLEYYYNNTMTSYGPTTRELVGGKDWYRVTPVDLSVDGVYTYDLIASNRYVVGTVTIKVEAGELTVSYDVEARPCTVKKEALKIYASKADLATGNAIEAKVDEPINAAENFGSDTKVLVSLILTGDYATNGYKVTNMVINKAEIAAMIASMD